MALESEYDFEYLKNQSEKFVFEEMERQLNSEENSEICKCQDCILDIAAFSLNNIKPMYKVSLVGEMYTKTIEGTEYQDHLKEAVSAAIDRIGKNPAHEDF